MNGRRGFGFSDHFALWANLGASLFLMPFGALLVPALSIEQAIAAALVAALLASLLVAAITWLASRSDRSTLGLLTGPLGDRARVPMAVLLVLRHTLFACFALVLITDSATLLGERSLGADLRPLWVLVFAGVALPMSIGFHRWAVLRRISLGLVVLLAIAISFSAYGEFEIPSYLTRPAVGGWPSFWQAVDIMLVFPLLWLPIAADHARGSPDSRSAALGAFAGLFLMTAWFGTLGIIYLPATDSGDIPGFLVGMQLGLGALIFLLVLQLDEVFLNTHSVQSLASDFEIERSALTPILPLLIAIPTAMFLHVGDLQGYLLLLGAVFVPAFAVVIAHELHKAPQPLAVPLIAWLGGFVLYQWLSPAEIGWWQDVFSAPFDAAGVSFPLTGSIASLGAAVSSFLLAFVVELAIPALAALPGIPRQRPQTTG